MKMHCLVLVNETGRKEAKFDDHNGGKTQQKKSLFKSAKAFVALNGPPVWMLPNENRLLPVPMVKCDRTAATAATEKKAITNYISNVLLCCPGIAWFDYVYVYSATHIVWATSNRWPGQHRHWRELAGSWRDSIWGYVSTDGLIDVAFISISIYNPPALDSHSLFVAEQRRAAAGRQARAENVRTNGFTVLTMHRDKSHDKYKSERGWTDDGGRVALCASTLKTNSRDISSVLLPHHGKHIDTHSFTCVLDGGAQEAALIDLYIRSNWWAKALNKCEECS